MSFRRGRLALVALLAATSAALWFARVNGLPGLAGVLIPVFVLVIFASVVAWADLGDAVATRFAQLAFGLIAAGDVFINLTPWPAVAAPAFIGAHVCLAAAFVRTQGFHRRDLRWLLPPAFAVLVFAHAELPRVSGAVRSIVFVVYLLALLAMAWRALCSADRSAKGAARILGASLFFATDLCAIAEIIAGTNTYAAWIWTMYPPALIALAWSCWGANPIESIPSNREHGIFSTR